MNGGFIMYSPVQLRKNKFKQSRQHKHKYNKYYNGRNTAAVLGLYSLGLLHAARRVLGVGSAVALLFVGMTLFISRAVGT